LTKGETRDEARRKLRGRINTANISGPRLAEFLRRSLVSFLPKSEEGQHSHDDNNQTDEINQTVH
jgi:hypothetical protein